MLVGSLVIEPLPGARKLCLLVLCAAASGVYCVYRLHGRRFWGGFGGGF